MKKSCGFMQKPQLSGREQAAVGTGGYTLFGTTNPFR